MANLLKINPMIIDSVGVISAVPININGFIWVEPSTQNHELIVLDKAGGNIIFQKKHTQTSLHCLELFFPRGQDFAGIYVTQIDSGALFIYLP